MIGDRIWHKQCPHCRQRIVFDLDAGVVHRAGKRAVSGALKSKTIKLKNPVESGDLLFAWRDRLDMSGSKAARQVGIAYETWRRIEEGNVVGVSTDVYQKIKEATGICL